MFHTGQKGEMDKLQNIETKILRKILRLKHEMMVHRERGKFKTYKDR